MTEDKLPQKSATDQSNNTVRQMLFFLAILGALVIWGVYHPSAALRVLAVLLGFGGIIMVHEFGHFIVAKLGGIKVEAFSIGFPPVVLGIRKLKKGWRLRVLPKIGEPVALQEGDHETEYQIGLFPIGGFVKMLGQSDTGSAEATEDPRSYTNRPVWIRMATIAAGVIFNAVGAILIFMVLFMHGLDQKPAVVGNVMANSPAADAGLHPGDRIIEVNGERFVNFEWVGMAPALSAPGEPISFVVRRDGAEQQIKVIAEKRDDDNSGLRATGISPAQTLTIEPLIAKSPELTEEIYKLTGLRPGDAVKAIDGKSVTTAWDFEESAAAIFKPQTTVTVSRQWPPDAAQRTTVTHDFPLEVLPVVQNFRNAMDLAHFGTMVPLLKIDSVVEPPAIVSLPKRLANWFSRTVLSRPAAPRQTSGLEKGDILIKIADQDYPTYKQLRELTIAYKDKDLPLAVLRKDQSGQWQKVEVTMQPRVDPGTDRVIMRIVPVLDMQSPVVAQTIPAAAVSGQPLEIPAGARIKAIDDKSVSSFFEIASALQAAAGKKVTVHFEADGQPGQVGLAVPAIEPVHARAMLGIGIPLADLTEEFKASNPIQAAGMGLRKTWHFVLQSYITLGRLFQGSVPVSALSGPVGIIQMTYQVAGTSLADYLYFMGLISSCLAVMNLLPLPVLDGGHLVILLIEKISGKPINERVLAGAMYAGMALLLGVFVIITYKDLIRILFP
ncbi:MAG: RIP metalloprotease RseP [Planctomycetaceae bacterium]|nr:RIP metalloprotease RseP [Planctomycetaceae bacterium]